MCGYDRSAIFPNVRNMPSGVPAGMAYDPGTRTGIRRASDMFTVLTGFCPAIEFTVRCNAHRQPLEERHSSIP